MPPNMGGMPNNELRRQIKLAERHRSLSQTQLLAHCLRRQNSPIVSTKAENLLRGAVIVGIDAEWFEYDASRVTELGVSILLPHHFFYSDSPSDIISKMQNFHVRIQHNPFSYLPFRLSIHNNYDPHLQTCPSPCIRILK